jgi:hypothetical protein
MSKGICLFCNQFKNNCVDITIDIKRGEEVLFAVIVPICKDCDSMAITPKNILLYAAVKAGKA